VKPIDDVRERLAWLRQERIWPEGVRDLWADAFGLVVLLSLHERTRDARWLADAEALVADVERASRRRAPFRAAAMWIFALGRFGAHTPGYRTRALERATTTPLGNDPLAPYFGHVVFHDVAPRELAQEIAVAGNFVEKSWRTLVPDEDLDLGMMLWLSHFQPEARWAMHQRRVSLARLDLAWIDPPGYFCQRPEKRDERTAVGNYAVALGLRAVNAHTERALKVLSFFERDATVDRNAATQLMACAAWVPGELLRPKERPATAAERGGGW
jgi:hypothetical protein